ncbi:hypothetical protein [Nitrosospira multiformis]|uniref:Uncharacterized protein n=1 Tax=Nitrosospira multiformis TaxID=1231 RepID=A0A1I7H8R8_9PROT|nr:hypothetical protein [Nitrosospira multiformis]SFU57064.1 hypothetical protein SAMN05216417_107159 [Nitrosospira multiformis]
MEELNKTSKMELEIMEFLDNERIDYKLHTRGPGLASPRSSRTIEMEIDYLVLAMYRFSSAKLQETVEGLTGAAVKVVQRRRRANKARVANRSDQKDRRAFQEAILANIEHYPTIAAARRDLQKKPQFQNRHYATLERWASKVWPTKPKVGRPKKRTE